MSIVITLTSGTSKTLLQIIQSACKRLALTVPSTVYTSSDPQIIQMISLLEEEGADLSSRHDWQSLNQTATFTTVASESQGDMATIAPDYRFIVNDTIWNRTLRRPVFGPRSSQQWQQNLAFAINGPWSNFRVIGDYLHFYPTPTAGQTCAFEVISKNWITDGSLGYSSFNADSNTTYFDDEILLLGLIWRWKQSKGLEYSEDFNKYDRKVMDAIARDGSKTWLNLTDTHYDIYPAVVVPAGSWNL